MGTAQKDCIWFDQCGHECPGSCDEFSPVDSSDEDIAFYRQVLNENACEYSKLIFEFLGKDGM